MNANLINKDEFICGVEFKSLFSLISGMVFLNTIEGKARINSVPDKVLILK